MFPVAAVAVAGWLLLFVVLLMIPPSPGPRAGGGPGQGGALGEGGGPGDEPPAVISLLAGQLDKLGFGVTLIDLAARGWFRLDGPAGPAGAGGGTWGPAGPAMCVVSAEPPTGPPLAPFERRVLAHVALRAGVRGEVPAPALSDGFEGGEEPFMSAFRTEVDAEARRLGLTRSRLSAGRIGLLCLLLFIPAGALLLTAAVAHRHYPLAYGGGAYVAGCVVAIGVGASRRPSAAGQAALERWRLAVAAPGDARLLAYAAALGAAPGAPAVFAPGGTNMAWSNYRGSWQQIEIETSTWSWPRACLLVPVIVLATLVAPVAYVGGAIWLGTHGMATLAEAMAGLLVAGVVAAILMGLVRRSLFPRAAEFDGQVIRQWVVKGDSESPDQYRVAIDDGTRDKAWDLEVGDEPYRQLTPGTFVYARVNLRNREDVTVRPVEPPAIARPLAAMASQQGAADQERAAAGGLPDPAGKDGFGSCGRRPLRGRIPGSVRDY